MDILECPFMEIGSYIYFFIYLVSYWIILHLHQPILIQHIDIPYISHIMMLHIVC